MIVLYRNDKNEIFELSPLDFVDGLSLGFEKLTLEEVEEYLNPGTTQEQMLDAQIIKAKQYLSDTDHKFYNGYVPKPGEDCEAIKAIRDEKREFIRANE